MLAEQIIGVPEQGQIASVHKSSIELHDVRKTFPANKYYWFIPGKGMIYTANDSFKNKIYKVKTDNYGAIKSNNDSFGLDGNILYVGDAVASQIFLDPNDRIATKLENHFIKQNKDVKIHNYSHPNQVTNESKDITSYFGQRKKFDYVILFGLTESLYYLRHFGTFYNRYYEGYYIKSEDANAKGIPLLKKNIKHGIFNVFSFFAPHLTKFIYKTKLSSYYFDENEKSIQNIETPKLPTMDGHYYIYDIRTELGKKEIVDGYARSIELFIKQARILDIEPVIVIDILNKFDASNPSKENAWLIEFMEKINDTPYEDFVELHKRMQNTLVKTCKNLEVKCIDLSDLGNDEYMYDLKYLNAKGSQVVSERIAETLYN